MKSLCGVLTLVALFFFGSSLYAQSIKVDASKKMPYTALYSSDFKIGNSSLAKKILDVWKDWDDNELDRHDYFSDTLEMFFPDGTVLKGKANAMAASKAYRATLGTVTSQIHAWVPMYSNDKKEDVILVWGREDSAKPDGTKTSTDIHEAWWFNKDGKVTGMRQWTAHFGGL